MILWIDLETFSPEPISSGAYRYAERAKILLVGYAVDDAPAQVADVTHGFWPEDLEKLLRDQSVLLIAHNSNFDRIILRKYFPETGTPERWLDTMIEAFSLSLPGALRDLCEVCRLPSDKAKDADGKRLVRLFCIPRPDGTVATSATHPQDWQRFANYCRLDVEAMRAVHKALPAELLPRLPVWSQWRVDQRINDRGMCIDRDLVKAAAAAAAAAKDDADAAVARITGGAASSVGELDKIIAFCVTECGYTLPDMQRSTLEHRLSDPALPDVVRELISARLSAGKASVKKFDALASCTGTDGRLRGCLQFMGAVRTGRWTGRLFQPQNLPRGTMTPAEVEEAVKAIKSGIAPVLYPNITEVVSNCLRAAICAPVGKKLVVADLSNIEGRVLAWLAREQWKLDAFRAYDEGTGPDLYKCAYGRAFNVAPESVTKKQRMIGKVMELAMGYQGGEGAFLAFVRGYGLDLDEMAGHVSESCESEDWERAELAYARRSGSAAGLSEREWCACNVLKTLWRRAHPAISGLWQSIELAIKAVLSGKMQSCIAGRLTFRLISGYLVAKLPSGRFVCYPAARLTPRGGLFEYYGQIQTTRRWDFIRSYSGKVTENLTQATARDILAESMPLAEEKGYRIVLSVHDELITETPDSPEFSAEKLSGIMTTAPAWAEGLPLSAAGFEAYRYRKD